MTVLIVFATVEGQTGKIADFVRQRVAEAGRDVVIVEMTDETLAVPFDGVEEVILAAPVHERRHPRAFENFLASRTRELGDRRTLLISVSLSAAFEDGLEEAQDYVVEMKMRTGFTPDAEAMVAGAVRPGGYDYFQTQVVRHVVLRGRDHDPSLGEQEFTDWQALSATVADFLGGSAVTAAR
jgi:menaquinone-dependent protoporphyrinogen oxidase